MSWEIEIYREPLVEGLVEVFNRETECDPFVVSLTPEVFIEQIATKPYFSPEGCFLARENGEVVGFALTSPGIGREENARQPEIGVVDGLFFYRGRLEIGDALLDRCMGFFERKGSVKTVYGFASFGGYPYWRGLYCGTEPVCISSYMHAWVAFMARGFTHHQQSLNYLGATEPRTFRTDLEYGEGDLVFSGEWQRQTWKGHEPKVIHAALDGEVAGRLGYAELPFLSDYRGRRVAGIYSMHVEERLRRQGIASSLLNYLFDLTYGKGVEEILVGTTVGNTAARRAYEKSGMKPVGFRTGTMYRYPG